MSEQESINIGEDCLAKLDELIVILKRARRKIFFCIDLLDLIFGPLVNRDLKKAANLADEVRVALEYFKKSLGEDSVFSLDMVDSHGLNEAIDHFFDLVWDPPPIIVGNHLSVTKNTRSAVMHLLGHA